MSTSDQTPDVSDIAQSMLVLYGPHEDHADESTTEDSGLYRPNSREPLFPVDPQRYEAMRAATARDSDRYLHAGLTPVECGHCGASVEVKKLAPGYTAVQWDSVARNCCTYFAGQTGAGHQSSRTRGCPHMTQNIRDASESGRLGSATAPINDID